MAGNTTFLVLINQRSGGQDGPQLLDRFRQLAQEGLDGQEHLEVDSSPLTSCTPSYFKLNISLIPTSLLISGCFDD